MLNSMTGYGKSEQHFSGKTISVEIRSLNSKQMDLSLKMPSQYKDQELVLRNLLTRRLERGKIECNITCVAAGAESGSFAALNKEAVRFYYNELCDAARQLGVDAPDSSALLGAILRMPQVTNQSDNIQADEEELQALDTCVNEAIEHFISFRAQEGAALEKMFTEKLDGIEHLLGEVEPYEKGRIDNIRQRLENNLLQLGENTQAAIDRNRLEQEMIYYLEKLDITEEKVRLANHIRYFRETMESGTAGVGKKLGFIAQEMGREINTLGSKSNQSEMQIIVVKMKDLLEQIKEQVLNVL